MLKLAILSLLVTGALTRGAFNDLNMFTTSYSRSGGFEENCVTG